jgi:hypothetical protein
MKGEETGFDEIDDPVVLGAQPSVQPSGKPINLTFDGSTGRDTILIELSVDQAHALLEALTKAVGSHERRKE